MRCSQDSHKPKEILKEIRGINFQPSTKHLNAEGLNTTLPMVWKAAIKKIFQCKKEGGLKDLGFMNDNRSLLISLTATPRKTITIAFETSPS
jgi:hypothetical protein